MPNPLLGARERRPLRKHSDLRRRRVPVPKIARIDALFLILRRMRAPLLILVGVYVISILGFTLAPGRDPDGNVYYMSVFDAFYFLSYTATTIGFGELPYSFTPPQRLWATVSIYLSVLAWAYTFGTLFQLMRDSAFQTAMARQRFAGRIRAFREDFVIIAGYGHTGRMIAHALDGRGVRLVVLDNRQERIDTLESDQLVGDVPGLVGDASNVSLLGLAGLGHPRCKAVLAMTDDDEQNLGVVTAARLLQPSIRVIARCQSRAAANRMALFEPEAVLNPYDRYGAYLTLALHRPVVYQLVKWLLNDPGEPMPPCPEGLTDGTWVVMGDGEFGREIARDLRRDGLEVRVVEPDDDVDVQGIVGFVAGTDSDSKNLAAAAHVRLADPHVFLSVRQHDHNNRALLTAFDPDSAFFPSEIIVDECLARMASPGYWGFIDHLMHAEELDAKDLLERLVRRVGKPSPDHLKLTVGERDTPAVVRWMENRTLTVGELLRDPANRDRDLRAAVVEMLRGSERTILPPDDLPLQPGDKLVLIGTTGALNDLGEALYDDSTLQYLVTGRDVPTSLVWRLATGRVLIGDRRDEGGDL